MCWFLWIHIPGLQQQVCDETEQFIMHMMQSAGLCVLLQAADALRT